MEENKIYFDAGYLIEIGDEIHGKFGDIEGTIRPVNIVCGWVREDNFSDQQNNNRIYKEELSWQKNLKVK